MVQTAVTQVIQSLEDLERNFGVSRSPNPNFFPEWQTNLPALLESDTIALNQVRDRFRYQRKQGPVGEGTINAIVVSPLLGLAGFYDPPFTLRSEASISLKTTVQIEDEDGAFQPQILRGRIDFLVLQDQFWQAVIESKETTFDIEMGIPQILAYMMAAPNQQDITFGMVTNGNHFAFIKLKRGESSEYDFSDTFSMLPQTNRLHDVLQILKRVGTITAAIGS
jgi:hypothetical protein